MTTDKAAAPVGEDWQAMSDAIAYAPQDIRDAARLAFYRQHPTTAAAPVGAVPQGDDLRNRLRTEAALLVTIKGRNPGASDVLLLHEAADALASQAARMGEWQPIETCPYNQIVLLWCPENSPWAATAWKGRRVGGDSRNDGYDEGFTLATPYGHMQSGWTKQVWCPIDQHQFWPTHWMPLPAPPAAIDKLRGEAGHDG